MLRIPYSCYPFGMERLLRDLPHILEGLSAIVVGTRDDALVPACVLGAGVAADPSGRVTIFVPEVTGGETFANVARNGRVSVTLEHIPTHRTVQIKGRCLEMRPAVEAERPIVDRIQEAFLADVEAIGAPGDARRRRRWPCRAITFEVAEIYEQTPGPHAGFPFGEGRAPAS